HAAYERYRLWIYEISFLHHTVFLSFIIYLTPWYKVDPGSNNSIDHKALSAAYLAAASDSPCTGLGNVCERFRIADIEVSAPKLHIYFSRTARLLAVLLINCW